MFKLYVAVFLITNGVAAEQPSGVVPNKNVFPTQEACMGYFDTDAGKKSKLALDAMLEAQGSKYETKVFCVEITKGESL